MGAATAPYKSRYCVTQEQGPDSAARQGSVCTEVDHGDGGPKVLVRELGFEEVSRRPRDHKGVC